MENEEEKYVKDEENLLIKQKLRSTSGIDRRLSFKFTLTDKLQQTLKDNYKQTEENYFLEKVRKRVRKIDQLMNVNNKVIVTQKEYN